MGPFGQPGSVRVRLKPNVAGGTRPAAVSYAQRSAPKYFHEPV